MLNRTVRVAQKEEIQREIVSALPKQTLRQHSTATGIALVFALIQSHIISLEFKLSGYSASVNIAFGVVTGHPYYKEYQNRILGPYIVLAISKITHSYLNAHFILGLIAMTVAGYLSWQLGLRIGGDIKASVVAFLALQFGFCYLLCPPWLYTWDYLGLVIFLVFLLMVVDQKSWQWFFGLFVFAILNRESGEFIAVWMIFDPFAKAFFARSGVERSIVNWRMVIAGVCCLISGIAVVEFLRAHLTIEEMAPLLDPGSSGHQTGLGELLLQMRWNISEIREALHTVRNGFEAPMLIFPLAAIYYSIRLALREPGRWLGISLVMLTNLAAIFLVGNVLETRIYLELLPFVVLGILVSIGEPAMAKNREKIGMPQI